ncbi:hypothetical protein ACVGXX_00535, partial [Enterobacter intestinihominis]
KEEKLFDNICVGVVFFLIRHGLCVGFYEGIFFFLVTHFKKKKIINPRGPPQHRPGHGLETLNF